MVLAPLYPAHAQKARARQPARTQDEAARYIKAAERLYEALEYERALEQLAQARRLPRSLDEDVTIALFEGLIFADMGKRGDARVAFKTGLLLDPKARLPVRAAPKVEQEFEEVRSRVCKELGLQGCKPREDPKARPPEVVTKPTGPTDRPVTTQVDPPVPKTESPPWLPSSVRMGSTSVPTHSLAMLGAGVVAGGVGGFFGLKSRGQLEDARGTSYQQELAHRRDEAVGSARAANVLFGTAGLLATGAVVTWLMSGGEEVPNEEAAR
jgi:tetratricopeptide (TPR) repeat protein